jgi:hypothetical protein
MTHKFSLMLLLWLLLISPQLAASGEPRYPVLDSKFPAAEAKLGWIDNERVMFHGYDIGKMTQPGPGEGHPTAAEGLFIWDTGKGTVTKYWDIDGPTSLCVYHDTIAFGQRIKGEQNAWIRTVGKIGQEQSVRSTGGDWVNPISCAYSKRRPPEVTGQRILRHLREEHGYLDFGSAAKLSLLETAKVLYYRPGWKDPLYLPFATNRVLNLFDYVEFEDAYLLQGRAITPDAVPLWLLRPDGTVTQLLEPKGKSWERIGWVGYIWTKRGLLLISRTADGYAAAGKSGGYLLDGDNVKRLIVGLLDHVAVSPNGCKLAFGHVLNSQAGADSAQALRKGKPGTRTLKMIDLCVGKGE